MAGQDRTTPSAVSLQAALEQEPYGFDYFQALRLLECAHRDKPRIGMAQRPADESVRLGQKPSLSFAGSTLAAFEPGKKGLAPRLTSYFFGLFGPHGPLPLHLTEYAYDRQRNSRDATFTHFLDLFHHRMLSLFYRAWSNSRPAVSFDRPEEDWFGGYMAALIGREPKALRKRDAMPDLAKLHYAGLLSSQTRNADGLRAMVCDFFGLPVRIEEFIGSWMDLPDEAVCRLGLSPDTGALGQTAIAGARVWGRQQRFRIVIGPLSLADYRRFLPGSDSLSRLVAVVRNYFGDELGWDVNLVIKGQEVPALKLGESGRLGWTTWLGAPPEGRDAVDLILDPMAQGCDGRVIDSEEPVARAAA